MNKIKGLFRKPTITSVFASFAAIAGIFIILIGIVLLQTFSEYSNVNNEVIDNYAYENELNNLLSQYNKFSSPFYTYVNTGSLDGEIMPDSAGVIYLQYLSYVKDKYPVFPYDKYKVIADSTLSVMKTALRRQPREAFQYMDEMTGLSKDNVTMITEPEKKRNNAGTMQLREKLDNYIKIRLYLIGFFAVMLLAGIIAFTVLVNRMLKRELGQLILALEKMTRSNDFSHDIKTLAKFHEILNINNAVMNFISIIRSILNQLNDHASGLAAFSEELSASSEEVSSATEEVSASTENITSDILLLKEHTDMMSASVETMNKLMTDTVNYLEKAKNVNEEFIGLMSNETDMIGSSSEKFVQMEESLKNVKVFIDDFSSQVNTIQVSVDSIKSIHKKIELLSLNAAIEASRAGKEGGGFAVIAEEIRTLSSKSADASGEIERIMGDVISNIKQLHSLINHSIDGFTKIQTEWKMISDISSKVSNESQNTYEETNKLNKQVGTISDEFKKLNQLFNEIKTRMDNVVASSEQISSSNEEISSQMEELTSSSQELNDKALNIKDYVEKYKV